MRSNLFNGQGTTDKNGRKYRYMSIILFPICANVVNYYKERRQMDNSIIKKENDY